MLLDAYISYAGFFPLQCPSTHAMLVTPVFPCLTSPWPMLLPWDINHAQQTDRRFFRAWSFSQSAGSKSLPALVMALLLVLASSSHDVLSLHWWWWWWWWWWWCRWGEDVVAAAAAWCSTSPWQLDHPPRPQGIQPSPESQGHSKGIWNRHLNPITLFITLATDLCFNPNQVESPTSLILSDVLNIVLSLHHLCVNVETKKLLLLLLLLIVSNVLQLTQVDGQLDTFKELMLGRC